MNADDLEEINDNDLEQIETKAKPRSAKSA